MKFAFEEFHLWYQFALSLMAAGKVGVLVVCVLWIANNNRKSRCNYSAQIESVALKQM